MRLSSLAPLLLLLGLSCAHRSATAEEERERAEHHRLTDPEAVKSLSQCFDAMYLYTWRDHGRCARYDVIESTRSYVIVRLTVADACANEPAISPVDERFRVYRKGGQVEYWQEARQRYEHYLGCREEEREDEKNEKKAD